MLASLINSEVNLDSAFLGERSPSQKRWIAHGVDADTESTQLPRCH